MRLPISLIIDDGAPINTMFWHDTAREHTLLVPAAFTRGFADLCKGYGVKGKFSVLPIPAGMGRIDEQLARVPPRHLAEFLEIVRGRIAPAFDITPEILTHHCAYSLEKGHCLHLFEDEWVARASLEEITDYVALSLQILRKVRLPGNGVTSPWSTGQHDEDVYARAIGDAFWRVHRCKFSWYFLHCLGHKKARWPWVASRDKKTGRTVVTVPANTDDVFWQTQYEPTLRKARAVAMRGVDTLLTADGRSGRIRDLFDAVVPITILTHWQSLFGNGHMAGLWGLDALFERIGEVFGEQVEWMPCSKLARMALKRE